MLLIVGTLAEVPERDIIYGCEDGDKLPVYEQTVPELYKIAEGCFSSTWHIIKFDDNEEKAVGVAYHA